MNYLQALKANLDENNIQFVPKPLPSQPFPILRGENQTLEYSSQQVGSPSVALFFALVRNIPETRVVSLMKDCIKSEAPFMVADLFLLAFQTRDCRGGKGERNLFYKMLIFLFNTYPQTVLALVPLIGEYGYYKDYFNILSEIGTNSKYQMLKDRILDVVANQLIADEAIYEKNRERLREHIGDKESNKTALSLAGVSLCAKYAPREGNKFQERNKELFRDLLRRLFPEDVEAGESTAEEAKEQYQRMKKRYRKLIAKLTAVIDVPEVKMCGKRFAEISFDHVPSLCMKKYRKAFANESVKGLLKAEEVDTGNRYPNDPDRVECRQHLLLALKQQKVKGKLNYPHEIANMFMGGIERSQTEIEIFEAQWVDIRNNIVKQIEDAKSKPVKEGATTGAVDLGKVVPMVDVSGSMSGTPMEVAISLGILISELNHPAFRDRFITFDSVPQWVDLSDCSNIAEKVKKTQMAPWGCSTNIEAAFQLIEDAIEKHGLKEEDIPSLIIFSDMQFDVAVGQGRSQTQLQRIEDRFARLGQRLYGHVLPRPTIIFWNLRGDTRGFPATASTANVQMLSGFSPSLFKHVIDGSALLETEKPTSSDIFRRAMDDERYDKVREILLSSKEGVLAQYVVEG